MFKQRVFITTLALLLTACGEPVQLAPDAVLPDGGVYQGSVRDGLFDGKGTLKYSSGAYYDGHFDSGLYHGQGIRVFSNGSRYEGQFVEGKMTGNASFTTDNYEYVGGFNDGKFEGHGKINYKNGVVYEGEFLNSLYHGKGVLKNADGSHYEGEFNNNYYDGLGKASYENGAVYEGQFKAGMYQGPGRYSIDEAWYEGEFVDNQLSGESEYLDAQGNRYTGQASEWRAHGEGELVMADGSVLKGLFEYGALEGAGEKTAADGSHYQGNFEYNEYEGKGVLRNEDGSIYDGEFSYGRYHGQGVLTTTDAESGETTLAQGRWRRGKLAFNSVTGEREHSQAGLALENHQTLLASSLTKLKEGDDQTNIYFLGVAGDGSQSVFRRELEFVSQQIENRYQTQDRSVLLINHHDSATLYPMATRRSIGSSIAEIGKKMDTDDDVLFMYLSSHGSTNHDLYLNHDSIRLPDISPQELKVMLDESKIKWRVIMVSACYAGGFIAELENDHTMLMTAADAQSTSFGCSDESEMTYFGKAFFREVFSKESNIELSNGFAKAKEIVQQWEAEQELEPSNPMISAPKAISKKMAEF
jgi:hypothetical protein